MKKMILPLVAFLLIAPMSTAANVYDEPVQTEQAANSDKVETEKEKKDREKKEKKEREKAEKEKKKRDKKKQRSVSEILTDLQALEWDKPASSGLDIDKWYDEADSFFALVKGIEDNVPLYTIAMVKSPDGTTIIAPVDKNGTIRHRGEAFEQVAKGVLYGTNVALAATNLALGTTTNAFQIGQDAIPFVGDASRKKANMQIVKATKAIPLLKEIVTTQNNMMNKYKEMNFNLTSGDMDVAAMEELNIDPENTLTMSDEEIAAYLEAEAAE